MKILVTGGAGFIGSNLIRYLLNQHDISVLNIDKLVFPGSYHTIEDLDKLPDSKYCFSASDICDSKALEVLFREFAPDAVMHLAAESHVDRSIATPESFIQSNIVGTYQLLDVAKSYWDGLTDKHKERFRFLHVSTDEVFGSLSSDAPPFSETHPYQPNSPYSASKAGSDHLARAWYHTYGLPVLISNCSNNYGPYQFPEKLIPLMILKAVKGEPLPVYGDGGNVRDWLFVEDHVTALFEILTHGMPGDSYNIGGCCELSNNEVVETICRILDELLQDSGHRPHNSLIQYVTDRPGHDRRYAMDISHIKTTLGWSPKHEFKDALRKTVIWYLDNYDWCEKVMENSYDGKRLGLI